MISFRQGDTLFQLRAAALVFDGDRLLLHRAVGDDFWSLPGGRVEPGEASDHAVYREMLEELGEPVQVHGLACVVESFFRHADAQWHELGFFYRCSLRPDSPLLLHRTAFAGIERHLPRSLEFAWFDRAQREGLTLYPAFLRDATFDPAEGVRHVVEREASEATSQATV